MVASSPGFCVTVSDIQRVSKAAMTSVAQFEAIQGYQKDGVLLVLVPPSLRSTVPANG